MTTAVLSPTSTVSTVGSTTATGGSVPTIITDSSDSTYLQFDATSSAGVAVTFALGTFTLSTGRLKSWLATVRGAQTGSSLSLTLYPVLVNSVTGAVYPLSGIVYPPVASVVPSTQSTASAVPPTLSQTEIDGLQVRFTFTPGANVELWMYEMSVSVTYAVAPTANITYPTGTPAVGTSSPTVTWTHAAGSDGGPQVQYEVKVFSSAQYGAGGFSADTSTPTYTSGVVTSSATAHTVGPLANSGTFRAYVRTAQSVNGSSHWSAWDFEGFTTSYSPSNVTSVTPVATSASGYITVTVARNTGTAAWSTLEVERQDPDGVWRPVRGATGAGATNTFVTTFSSNSFVVRDYEAANGASVTYRARATTSSGVVGDWTSSSSTSWSSSTYWLKDVHDPSLNVEAEIREQPQPTSPMTQGVFQVIGGRYPTVVSDVRRARVGTFVAQTEGLSAAQAFEAAVQTHAKLVQFPSTHLWGSKYVAIGDVQTMYPEPNNDSGLRHWQVAFVEIDQPADETDY